MSNLSIQDIAVLKSFDHKGFKDDLRQLSSAVALCDSDNKCAGSLPIH